MSIADRTSRTSHASSCFPGLLVAALCLLLSTPALASSAPRISFALVVTNNRSLRLDRPDLHYADDDGAAFADLFADLFGATKVRLLTRFDNDSAPLMGRWVALALPPTIANLHAVVAELGREVTAVRADGREVEVYLVLAGHGDVEYGQGFLELEDERFTAVDLERDVLARLPADRFHLIVDSCNSYFMLNPRKPGGERWQTETRSAQGLAARYPNLGAVLSTSAEALSYEWSELRSGIFSFVVRSGLRGAADADGDGTVAYAELAAFIATAVRPIVNDLFRPKVYTSAPLTHGLVLLTLPADYERVLVVESDRPRRVSIRDGNGVRVAELHSDRSVRVRLYLPLSPDPLLAYEMQPAIASASRPSLSLRRVPQRGQFVLDALPEDPPLTASRGAPLLIDQLFATPFGPQAFAAAGEPPLDEEVRFGITRVDAQRLADHLRTTAFLERDARMERGILAIVSAIAVGMVAPLAVRALREPEDETVTRAVAAGVASGLLLTGLVALNRRSAGEVLYDDYSTQRLESEGARAKAVLSAERSFAAIADEAEATRRLAGYALTGAGLLGGVAVALDLWRTDDSGGAHVAQASGVVGAAALVAAGSYVLWGMTSPTSRVWDLYREYRPVLLPHGALSSVTIAPAVSFNAGASPSLGLSFGARW